MRLRDTWCVLLLCACNCDEPEHCEGTKIVACTSSSHQPDPGCSPHTVKDCADYDAVCADTPSGPICAEPGRSCEQAAFTFCEDNAVRVCRYGHVASEEITPCVAEQRCITRPQPRGESRSFCGFWPEACVDGEQRCYSDTVAATCEWQTWSERTYCEPGTRCDEGECIPRDERDASDDDAGSP